MSDSESQEVRAKSLSSDNLETKGTSEHFVQSEIQREVHSVIGEQKRAFPRKINMLSLKGGTVPLKMLSNTAMFRQLTQQRFHVMQCPSYSSQSGAPTSPN